MMTRKSGFLMRLDLAPTRSEPGHDPEVRPDGRVQVFQELIRLSADRAKRYAIISDPSGTGYMIDDQPLRLGSTLFRSTPGWRFTSVAELSLFARYRGSDRKATYLFPVDPLLQRAGLPELELCSKICD